MPAADRRQQIVDVAAELFSQKGFSGTMTKEIADRVGVSEAIIFRHFESKEALYSAILDYKVRQTAEQIQEHLKQAESRKDDFAFFRTLAFDLLEMYRNDPTLMRLLMFSGLEGHKLSEIFFESTMNEVRMLLRRYVAQRIEDGTFRKIDPIIASRAFGGMIVHQVFVWTLYKDDMERSSAELADQFTELFLTGVRMTNHK